MMMNLKTISLSFALCLLAGCGFTSEQTGDPHPYFGNAVNQNIAAQRVNPDAPVSNETPDHDGMRMAIGQGRYVTDTVETPATLKTSDIGGEE